MKKVVAAVWCAAVLTGCSIPVTPGMVPSSAGTDAVSLNDAVVIVSSAEQDASEYVVKNDKGDTTAIRVNRTQWAKRLVEALASELAKRGARVRINAPVALTITLPAVVFNHFGDLYQMKVTASVADAAGWSRQYDGVAETTMGPFESGTEMTSRLAGDALGKTIRAMMRDEDFVARLRNAPGPAGAAPQ